MYTKTGSQITDAELAEFQKLVLCDPQVAPNHLPDRIRQAHYLTFLRLGGELVAIGAIKNNPNYWCAISEESGFDLAQDNYLGEVGYLHTADAHRGNGYGTCVLESLMNAAKGKGLFATVQSKNTASQRLLKKAGFMRVGNSWQSQQVDDSVELYVRILGEQK